MELIEGWDILRKCVDPYKKTVMSWTRLEVLVTYIGN